MSEEMLDTVLWLFVLVSAALPTILAMRRMRKFRADVAEVLSETTRQQSMALEKIGQAMMDMQKQQQLLAQQLQIVTTAYQRLRNDVVAELNRRADDDLDADAESRLPGSPTLH